MIFILFRFLEVAHFALCHEFYVTGVLVDCTKQLIARTYSGTMNDLYDVNSDRRVRFDARDRC